MTRVRIDARLDGHTCDVCVAWTGKEMTTGEAAARLGDCEADGGCRCLLVSVPARGNGHGNREQVEI